MNNNIPKEWIWTRLNSASNIIMGQSPPSITYNSEKIGLPFYQGKSDFGFLYPTPRIYCSEPNKIAERNDILISVRAPVGPTNLCKEKSCIGRGLAAIHSDRNNILYLFNFLKFIEKNIEKVGTGTTFKAISKNQLENLQIILPPLFEQNEIINCIESLFSKLDAGVEALKNAKEQIKTYRQAVLKWAFEGKLTSFKNHVDDAYYASSTKNAGILPEGWEWVKLGEVCKKVEKIKKKEQNLENEFFYLDISGIDNIHNKITAHKKYKWKDAPSRAQQIVKYNDILFSTVRTYLKNIAMINNLIYDNQIASTGFTIIRTNENFLDSNYIFNYVLYDGFLNPLNKLQTGTSYPAVRDSDVFEQLIPILPLLEQQSIVSEIERRFSAVDKLEQSIDESLERAKILKQSILKKAFNGELTSRWREEHQELATGENSVEKLLEKIKKGKEIK